MRYHALSCATMRYHALPCADTRARTAENPDARDQTGWRWVWVERVVVTGLGNRVGVPDGGVQPLGDNARAAEQPTMDERARQKRLQSREISRQNAFAAKVKVHTDAGVDKAEACERARLETNEENRKANAASRAKKKAKLEEEQRRVEARRALADSDLRNALQKQWKRAAKQLQPAAVAAMADALGAPARQDAASPSDSPWDSPSVSPSPSPVVRRGSRRAAGPAMDLGTPPSDTRTQALEARMQAQLADNEAKLTELRIELKAVELHAAETLRDQRAAAEAELQDQHAAAERAAARDAAARAAAARDAAERARRAKWLSEAARQTAAEKTAARVQAAEERIRELEQSERRMQEAVLEAVAHSDEAFALAAEYHAKIEELELELATRKPVPRTPLATRAVNERVQA
jgi:hypothetical protein